MIRSRLLTAILLSFPALSGGCFAATDAQESGAAPPPLDTSQYARFAKPGKGRIDGTFVLVIGKNGTAKPQSGVTVECYPDLPYTEWTLAATAAAVNKNTDTSTANAPSADDPKLATYVRVTKTDSDGNFHFYHLPFGRYIMRASLITPFPRTIQNQVQQQVGAIFGSTPGPGSAGVVVYDYSHAWFDSNAVYVGARTPFPPEFHLVARHNTFDPRR